MNNLKHLCAILTMGVGFCASAQAIIITADTSAANLANAVVAGGGLVIVGTPTLSGHGNGTGPTSSGTYTNLTGTYMIGPGIVLSSGDVNDYNDGPNTSGGNTTGYGVGATAAQEALLDPITGGSLNHNDVTQLNIDFTTSTGSLFFDVVFGSDEWQEFVGSSFIDAFGLYLDGVNIAFYVGQPININHTGMGARPGTELDGVLPAAGLPMQFAVSGLDTSATHSLTFIIADSGDSALDSTAFISRLGGEPPVNDVPEPSSLALLGLGLAGILARGRRKA